MGNISLIYEDILELVPIKQIIGEVRGPKKPGVVIKPPERPLFKFQGFAVNLVYRSRAEVNLNIAPSILVEFVIRSLPELSWDYEEIYFEGELLTDGMSDSDVRIANIFPCKSDIPTSIERAMVLEHLNKDADGIDLDIIKTTNIIKLAEARDKRISEIVQTSILRFEPVISSFHDERSFRWKIGAISEGGIQEQSHFYLWLSANKKIEYISMKVDMVVVATNPGTKESIELTIEEKDGKKKLRIPINYLWMA